jgi:hypothetical protein
MPVKSFLSSIWNAATRFSTKMEISTLEANINLAKSGLMDTGIHGPRIGASSLTKISEEAAAGIIKTSEERLAELRSSLNPKP